MSSESLTVRTMLEASAAAVRSCLAISDDIAEAARRIGDALEAGGTVLVCGNGGSAADAQHFAGELLGRFRSSARAPLAAVALSADGAVLSSIANDFEYVEVFARQVRALARPGDALVGISTSGRSENVVRALRAAPAGVVRIALLGRAGPLADGADVVLRVDAEDTAHVQAGHIAVLHAICELLEARFSRS